MGKEHTSIVAAVVWSPDGSRLASASWDGTIKLWDSADLTTSLDTGDEHKDKVRRRRKPGEDRKNQIFSVAWAPDGSRLASASEDATIKIWDSSNLSTALATGDDHATAVRSVVWSPDGARLASGSDDDTVKIWNSTDLSTALDTGDDHTDKVYSVAWAPDGSRLASASYDYYVKVWDSTDLGTALDTGSHHMGVSWSVAWSPDGTRLATSSFDLTVRVWNSSNLSAVLDECGGDTTRFVWSVAWSPDSSCLATSGTMVEIWNLSQPQPANCSNKSDKSDKSDMRDNSSLQGSLAVYAALAWVPLLGLIGWFVRRAWRRRAAVMAALQVKLLGLEKEVVLEHQQQLELVQQAELSREQKEALERQLGEQGGGALSASLLRSRIDMSQLQLGAVVGEGAYGSVRRGVYQQTPCAVKQLKRRRLTEEALAAFKREVELQLDLRHPNIIQLIGSGWKLDEGVARSQVCMVMELGSNGTLGKLLGDPLSQLDWGHERLSIGLGVARAMAYLHSVHIIHRDLKPENVLLADAMTPKVADFGVSREGDASLTMTAVGTPLFASPELLTHSRYDQTVDAWSFGCVIACLHHWRPKPYPGEPAASLVSRIVAGEVKPFDAIPDCAPLKALVRRCCALDPEERPSFLELCEQLEQAQPPPQGRRSVARARSFGSAAARASDLSLAEGDRASEELV